MEIGDLPEKEFKVMMLKIIKELGRRMDGQSEKSDFNKELENKREAPEMKNIITEMKNTLEGRLPWRSSGSDSMLPLQGAGVHPCLGN